MTEFTGERVVPGQVNDDLWAEHFSRYAFAARLGAGTHVLDVGCGTGYGSAELAQHARYVTGIDLEPEAAAYAQREFPIANLRFLAASATSLPFPPSSFQLITAFEVIEHIENWRDLLGEARRVLDPQGFFLVSTPNKLYYTESRGEQGANPFHVHEFEFEEFRAALREFFPSVTMLLQNHVEAFAFYPHGTFYPVEARLDSSSGDPSAANFFLGVCTIDQDLPKRSFAYIPRAANILREREHHIRSLEKQLREMRAEFDTLLRAHDEQTAHLENQNRWAKGLDEQIGVAAQAIERAEQDLIERTKWAKRLDARLQTIEASRWMRLGRRLGFASEADQTSE